ncbi:MAG TPA: hypothetical protein VF339_02800 [Gammaproteobacteria bacterium]
MLKRLSCLVAVSAVLGGPAFACDYPAGDIGELPRGATATQQEIDAARQRVAAYVRQLEEYAACMDGRPGGSRDRDRAIEEAQRVAERMNREIRQFNRSMQLRQAST